MFLITFYVFFLLILTLPPSHFAVVYTPPHILKIPGGFQIPVSQFFVVYFVVSFVVSFVVFFVVFL